MGHVLDGGAHWCLMANTIEWSVRDFDYLFTFSSMSNSKLVLLVRIIDVSSYWCYQPIADIIILLKIGQIKHAMQVVGLLRECTL